MSCGLFGWKLWRVTMLNSINSSSASGGNLRGNLGAKRHCFLLYILYNESKVGILDENQELRRRF